MPELPEVEQFRQLLLPLVSSTDAMQIELVGECHRIKLTKEETTLKYKCNDVIRKGKQLCLLMNELGCAHPTSSKYLFLHMGMTGSIRVPGYSENWGHRRLIDHGSSQEKLPTKGSLAPTVAREEVFPPKYTYLIFRSASGYSAYFCDPRKFGSCFMADDSLALDALSPDALLMDSGTSGYVSSVTVSKVKDALTNQRLGIKSLLLDQKRAVSGVGNWVADEVLYQCEMHPDQCYLTMEEAQQVCQTLQDIVAEAVRALKEQTHYPDHWLFHYRWTKKKATKDALGRNVTFVTSGGRTSAIVANIQKHHKRKKPKVVEGAGATKSKCKTEEKLVARPKTVPSDACLKRKSVSQEPSNSPNPTLSESPKVLTKRRRSPRFISP